MKKLESLGFRKARRISDILYAVAAVALIYRMMFIDASSPAAFPILAVSVGFFCIGMIIYSKGCRCPNCGKLQPRFSKYHCVDCNAELK